jgi:hypothetical protein
MPTARELLEQADALMRRNRKRDKRKPGDPPTLTDALGIDRGATLAPTIILPEVAAPQADPIVLETLADVPVLTDVVDVWASPRTSPAARHSPPQLEPLLQPAPGDGIVDHFIEVVGAKAAALEASGPAPHDVPLAEARADAEATAAASLAAAYADADEDAPDAMTESLPQRPAERHDPDITGATAAAAPPLFEEEFILEIPPPTEAATPASSTPADRGQPEAPAPAAPDWDALAEEIRMQVLQRLDLFADTGMRDRLGTHLQPIVDRACAELVVTINRELAGLVRTYVAEAIEREIESWRSRSG